MSRTINKNTIRRLVDAVWNQRDLSVIDKLVAEGFVEHQPPLADLAHGREGFRQLAHLILEVFPACRYVVRTLIADGDYVAVRFEFHGNTTHPAPLPRVVRIEGISIFRLRNNQIVDRWMAEDMVKLYGQLDSLNVSG